MALRLLRPPQLQRGPAHCDDAAGPVSPLQLQLDELGKMPFVARWFHQANVDRDRICFGSELTFQFLEAHAEAARPSTEALGASAGRGNPGHCDRPSGTSHSRKTESGSLSRSQTKVSGSRPSAWPSLCGRIAPNRLDQDLARQAQDVADRPQAQGFQALQDDWRQPQGGDRQARYRRLFISRGPRARFLRYEPAPRTHPLWMEGELDLKAALAPVVANGLEKRFLSTPKMSATCDFAEERFGKSSLFQTDQRREPLKFERQLAKGVTVGGEVGRKEDGFRQERLGLGQRLTDPKAEAFCIRDCRP